MEGMIDIGSIWSAGASTFDTAVNWIMYGQEKGILNQYRLEDKQLAEILRQDALTQQRFANNMANRQLGLAEQNSAAGNALSRQHLNLQRQAFNFGKKQWGEEFGFAKQQYEDKKKMDSYLMKRSGLQQLGQEVERAVNADQDLKNTVLARYGV